jgi:hypothetical protein
MVAQHVDPMVRNGQNNEFVSNWKDAGFFRDCVVPLLPPVLFLAARLQVAGHGSLKVGTRPHCPPIAAQVVRHKG